MKKPWEYAAKRARERTWYVQPGTPLIAFDLAVARLLDRESPDDLPAEIARLRVLFVEELARLEKPRSQARLAEEPTGDSPLNVQRASSWRQ